jgi:hypothetical protein
VVGGTFRGDLRLKPGVRQRLGALDIVDEERGTDPARSGHGDQARVRDIDLHAMAAERRAAREAAWTAAEARYREQPLGTLDFEAAVVRFNDLHNDRPMRDSAEYADLEARLAVGGSTDIPFGYRTRESFVETAGFLACYAVVSEGRWIQADGGAGPDGTAWDTYVCGLIGGLDGELWVTVVDGWI